MFKVPPPPPTVPATPSALAGRPYLFDFDWTPEPRKTAEWVLLRADGGFCRGSWYVADHVTRETDRLEALSLRVDGERASPPSGRVASARLA